MKTVVDARMIQHGGIGTYLRSVLEHLGSDLHPLLPSQMGSSIYSLREQIELPLKIPACDLFWSPHFNVPLLPIRAKVRIVTICDLFHLDHLAQFSSVKRLYAKNMLAQAISRSDRVITISEFSKERLLDYFPQAEEKIHVIHLGCDHLSTLQESHVQIERPFFLFVGNLKPHKNLPILLEALQNIDDVDLVIAGNGEGLIHGIDRKALEEQYRSLKGRIHFLGRVSDAELVWLYKQAEALLFPSLYEGWGLPPLEAMSFGCPVIASNAASIPEACGEACLYFDPTSVEDLIEQIQTLPKKKEKLIRVGKQRAVQFSWKKSAEEHRALFLKMGSLSGG